MRCCTLISNKVERRFTFNDMKRASNQCANYFKSLGIKKGDRVMLVLKRHYQFWYAILALHKFGAVAIPATNLLQEHDFDYRFNAAEVSAIVCTADGDVAHQVDLAEPASPTLKTKILVGGEREGWHNFDEEFPLYLSAFLPYRGYRLRQRLNAYVLHLRHNGLPENCGA